ncbi:hypothetical protein [Mesorhizobium sp. CN2-181]|uniref:hypothetical protein n=1 Tax=Mesorhizobium yinganensis TaxID=3157707 RepID=UPI0032B7A77F
MPGILARLRQALPTWRVAAAGTIFWTATMAASAAINLLADGWQTNAKIADVATVFAIGAALAFPLGYAAASLLARDRGWETRLAAAFLCFTVATIGITSALYAFDYRQYYAQSHSHAFSVTWMFQFAFTTAGALVQFAATGVRLYFPLGFAALAAVSVWFARPAR